MQNKSVTALVLPTDPRDPFDVISARTAGNEKHVVDGVDVRVYGVAKTIADCFKYRNKIGIDVAIEALTECWCSRACSADSIWRYAAVCRVTNVIRPVSRDSDRRRRPRISDERAWHEPRVAQQWPASYWFSGVGLRLYRLAPSWPLPLSERVRRNSCALIRPRGRARGVDSLRLRWSERGRLATVLLRGSDSGPQKTPRFSGLR